MRTISRYILEKLDINNVHLNKKFPIDESIDDVVKFLRDNGFEEIPNSSQDDWKDVHRKFDKNRGKKVFEYWPPVEVLRFADMITDISEENPIFSINSRKRLWLEEKLYDIRDKDVSKKEFLKLLNKVFGWK